MGAANEAEKVTTSNTEYSDHCVVDHTEKIKGMVEKVTPSFLMQAAIEIQNAAATTNVLEIDGAKLQVGIGITTGMAFTGIVGSDSCNDHTALGDAVNLASRLQGEATPGEVLLAEETHAVVDGLFPVDQVRSVELKGVKGETGAYRVNLSTDVGRT